MKHPVSLTDEELKQYADDHVAYEIDMLLGTASILMQINKKDQPGWLPWVCNNAILTSFSLHSRNLIDFLYLRNEDLGRERKTDIIIEDYINDATISKNLNHITARLKDARDKANRQSAHLTKDRLDREKSGKEWYWLDITNDIMNAFRSVANEFPTTKTSEDFRQKASRSIQDLPGVRVNTIWSDIIVPTGIRLEILDKTGEYTWKFVENTDDSNERMGVSTPTRFRSSSQLNNSETD